MKKLLLSLFAVLTATFAFAGDGTKTNPYTVAELQEQLQADKDFCQDN